MPLPAENLTPESNAEAIRQAISDSIAQCMREGGRDQAQCAAMSYEMARKATGKSLGRKG